jgi:tripartite-type tricarboxylate transporter receptor subunit TctC
MSKFLPTRINVVNKPGGVAGSIGMSYASNQAADGYTLVGLSESNVTAAVQGGWDKTFEIWSPFIIGGSPDVLSVNADSPYESLEDLVEASQEDPKAIKAAAGGSGSIHHLNLLAFEKGSGAKLNFIPYPGSAPGQNAAMTGEVSVVVTSLAEQQQLLKAGKLRPLGMLVEQASSVKGVGSIPSAFDTYPNLREYLPISQTIGFAVSTDAPQHVKDTLADAFKKALETDAVKQWAADNFYQLSGKTGKEASAQFRQLESLFSWTLHDLGAAKINPDKLGIEKP